MKNYIVFNVGLHSKLHWFCIGKGAKLNLLNAEYPLLCYAWNVYLNDNSAISGDLDLLEQLIFRPKKVKVSEATFSCR